jgi:hypothetical protein
VDCFRCGINSRAHEVKLSAKTLISVERDAVTSPAVGSGINTETGPLAQFGSPFYLFLP